MDSAAFPGLPIGRVVHDDLFTNVEVDSTFTALLGDAASLLGRPLDELISDRDHRGAVALASRLSQHEGEEIDLPLVICVAAANHFVRARLVVAKRGYLVYVEPGDREASLTYDLALARQRWHGVLQRSDEGIVLVDRAGVILEHNERFFELMQFRTSHGVSLTEAALQGRPLVPLLPIPFEDLARRLARGDHDFTIRIETQGRSLEIEARTLRIPLGGQVETLLLVRDVSEQRLIAERDAVIQADLDQAAAFQHALLSRMRSPRGLEIDVAYRPLHRVGGDLYDVALLADGTVRLFIADATGHGVTAALSTMLIKSEYDAVKDEGGSPAATLGALNDRITRTYLKRAVMFTAAIVDLRPDRASLVYACGGHPGALLCTRGGIVELAEGGAFLGAAPRQTYPEWTQPLDDWHSLVLITDGVVEARNAAGQQFGDARLHAAIRDAAARDLSITAHVLAQLDAFVNAHAQTDDITLLALRPARPS